MKKIAKTSTKKPASKKAATKKVSAKKVADFAKTHSISCNDKDWEKIQAAAKKAGMNVSKYIVSKIAK